MFDAAEYWTPRLPPPKGNKWDLFPSIDEALGGGYVAEFGVYKGASLRYLVKRFRRVHGFDSFYGLAEDWRPEFPAGAFSLDGQPPPCPPGAVLHIGPFEQTVPAFADVTFMPPRFIHIDSDTYAAAWCVLSILALGMVPGALIQFDEFFGYPEWADHEARAAMEFERLPYGLRLDPMRSSTDGAVLFRVVAE